MTKPLAQCESSCLAAYAVRSSETRGREHDEAQNDSRLPFERDRDRIIHSRAFRRLKDKTQVFVAHHGDHYRNRLTHSLEVAQISRGLARQLRLNEDLAESIALAHDLGHTPFGHAGEHALHECLQDKGLYFEHNEQSVRIVRELETVFPNHAGLNLSVEVLEGMMKHQTLWDHPKGKSGIHPSLEAQLVNLGDEIAYQNHDVDDGLRSGLFTEEDLAGLKLWQLASEAIESEYGKIEDSKIRWSRSISKMIGLMMKDVVAETTVRLETQEIESLEDVMQCDAQLVGFSEEMAEANKALKDFLMTRLYMHPEVLKHSKKGQETIQALFEYWCPKKGPEATRDYLAGMTDSFALEQRAELDL